MGSRSSSTLLRHIRTLASKADAERLSDRELLTRFTAERDEAAFANLVHRHAPMVHAVCHRVLRHAQDAEVEEAERVGGAGGPLRRGVVNLDGDGKISSFVEKPPQPTSTLIGIALYFYPRATLPLIKRYLAEGNNPDQPGRFVQWLYPRQPVYTWAVPGLWYDIGSKETLEEANRIFAGKAR